jgi:hypothetical protein
MVTLDTPFTQIVVRIDTQQLLFSDFRYALAPEIVG